jgi:queuine tRNA-ribosyltransferase
VAYLHHLFKAKELLALRLASIHNLRFVLRLMEDMRRSILENSFQSFKNNFMDGYKPTHEATRLSQKETWMEARNIRGG